ncbi:MAG: T9SS type A sorting domain-containing protein, partial [Flavobacteriales bacterium]|nr:T9SS type A sorting domain-containing protein [Flavobacteriales bacterium]
GYAMGNNTASRDGILHVLDLNGTVLDQRLIDVAFNSNAIHTLTATSHGALIAGRASGVGSYDMLLQQVDTDGVVLGSWSYGSTGWDWGHEAIGCSDGGMALVGYGDDVGGPAPSAYLVRTDAQGQELWARGIDGASADEGYCVGEDSVSGDLYIGGRSLGMGTGPGTRGFISKFTASGTHVWTRVTDNAFDPIGIVPLGNGRFAALLRAQNIPGGHGDYDALLVTFNEQGTLLGNQLFGTAASEYPVSLSRAAYGGLLITCFRNTPDDIYAVLVDSDGNGACTGSSVGITWNAYTPTIYDHTSILQNGYNPGLWPTSATASTPSRQFVCCTYPVVADFAVEPGNALAHTFINTSTGSGTASWSIEGGTYTGDTVFHSFSTPGTYTVCLTFTGICATDTSCQTVVVAGTGVNEQSASTGLHLWPQPATDQVRITSAQPFQHLVVLDVQGRVLKRVAVNGQRTFTLDLGGLPTGVHLLRATGPAGSVVQRLVIG